MINIDNVTKYYEKYPAVRDLSLNIAEREVFGMVGTNGAGKTTLLRMISGVLKADRGGISIDGEDIWDNPAAKARIFFIPDDIYFFMNATPEDMRSYYSKMYPQFDSGRFNELLHAFNLDAKRRISGFSKGMRKQLGIITGLCSNCRYLLCDETFDGLDPVMRQAVKSLFAADMEDRGLTPVLTSHNLRELEDICDHVGLLHEGGVLLSRDINDMKLGINKLQVVFEADEDAAGLEEELNVIIHKRQGRLHTCTVREPAEKVEAFLAGHNTVFSELLPLTLEEIFISETEVVGYDISVIMSA